jgi:hypothetical protein
MMTHISSFLYDIKESKKKPIKQQELNLKAQNNHQRRRHEHKKQHQKVKRMHQMPRQ